MTESAESLREALLDLERSRRAERELRVQTEGLLRGLELLGSTEDNQETFSKLLELLGDLLDFEHAVVLSGSTDEAMTPIAATSAALEQIVWTPGKMTRRALEGEPIAVFNASLIPEWQQVELEDNVEVVSALHIGLRDDPNASMLLCTHSEPGFFAPQDVQLARRFSMLATQALVNRDLRELKLRAFERSMRDEFFSVSRDLMGILDFDAQLQQANPAMREQLGYDLDSLCKRSFVSLVDERDAAMVRDQIARVIEQHDAVTFEARFSSTDDRPRWLQWNMSASPEDELIYAAGRDITQRRESEERLRDLNEELRTARDDALEASRAKSAFLANMSHELRTPLNAVIGYSEMLVDDLANKEGLSQQLQDVQRIKAAGNHLLALISDILDLSKIESGRMRPHFEPLDIGELLEDIEGTVAPLVARHDNTLDIEVPDALGPITSDETKLRQILFNLLSNAAKFTSDGAIEVSVEEVEGDDSLGQIRIHVSDTGIGISEEQLEHVFEAFTQADSSTTREFGGTGLGLTITQHFCSLLGGEIDVESTPNEGSTFTVTLPKRSMPQSDPIEMPDAPDDDASADDGKALVLIIEDDPDSQRLLKRTLLRDGYRVACASNGDEGLFMARQLEPDVITLDIMMPVTDGWTVLEELQQSERLRDTPVIMISMLEEGRRGLTRGASSFLSKPVDSGELLDALESHRTLH